MATRKTIVFVNKEQVGNCTIYYVERKEECIITLPPFKNYFVELGRIILSDEKVNLM